MNPLLDYEKEKGPGGLFAGLPDAPDPDATKALMGAASSMGGLLAGMRETAGGSLRKAWESRVMRDKLQESQDTLAGVSPDAYRPSENLIDKRRPFAPATKGSGYMLGSPTALLALDQTQGLNPAPAAAAQDQDRLRRWLVSNMRGSAETRLEPGLSRDPKDAALRQAVDKMLSFQLQFPKTPEREPYMPRAR